MELYLKNDKGEYLSGAREFSSTRVLWKIEQGRFAYFLFSRNDNGVFEYQAMVDITNYETIQSEQPIQTYWHSHDQIGRLGISLTSKMFCCFGMVALPDDILLLCEFPTYKPELK